MKSNRRSSAYFRWAAIIGVAALAIVPRAVRLDAKPAMHDESMFAYYSFQYITSKNQHYTHMPIMHGPVLMLSVGKMFQLRDWFRDQLGLARPGRKQIEGSLGSGRAWVAFCSLVALAASLSLWPRRYRWWLAPLLVTSPILLYFSRFLRNEMIYCGVLMVAMAAMARAFSRRPAAAAWAVVGMGGMLALLTIKENALFVYASGITFGIVYLLKRAFWRRKALFLRPRGGALHHLSTPYSTRPGRLQAGADSKPPHEKTSGAKLAKRKGRGRGKGKSRGQVDPQPTLQAESENQVPAPQPETASFQPTGRLGGFLGRIRPPGAILTAFGWSLGIVVGIIWILYIFAITGPSLKPLPLESMLNSWDYLLHLCREMEGRPPYSALQNLMGSWNYWEKQHSEHRIEGEIHYYLPILLTYELPILLMIAAGLTWDAFLRFGRLLVHATAILLWCLIWIIWKPFQEAAWLTPITDFLHVEPNASMLILGLMIAPMLAWSILQLDQHRPLAAWTGWWAACSLFQFSSAGEKVPWLAVHIILPLYLMLGWLWAPRLRVMGKRGRVIAIALMLVTTVIATRNNVYLIGERAANPRERLVYNHTSVDYDRLCRRIMQEWAEHEENVPAKQRRAYLVADTGWPGTWYFRNWGYQLRGSINERMFERADLVMGPAEQMKPFKRKLDPNKWNVHHMYLREAWFPIPFPPRDNFFWSLWDYYWMRKNWPKNRIGGTPIIVFEPKQVRTKPFQKAKS